MAVNGELVWKWIMRICAVAGFAVLLTMRGVDAGTPYYLLLLGLFFGPEILTGKVGLFLMKRDEAQHGSDTE